MPRKKKKPPYKTIGEYTFILKGDIYVPYLDAPSSRKENWITLQRIAWEFPQFFHKIGDILFTDRYDERAKEFIRSILFFLEVDKFISWKQFDSVFRICSTYREFLSKIQEKTFINRERGVVSVMRGGIGFTYLSADRIWPINLNTDRGFDQLAAKIFGHRPTFYEEMEEGMAVCYRDDGSRYFAIPIEELELGEYG